MKYAIIENINGAYFVRAEGMTELASAKVSYHDRCKILWNAPDVLDAHVAVMDENLNIVEGLREHITHAPQE
jgi:hypothetical protein